MIGSKNDLYFYIQEDQKANLKGKQISKAEWVLKSLYGHESIMACKYLLNLRKYEYTLNCCRQGFVKKLKVAYYKFMHHRLSLKYNILIMPNTVGYGISLSHFKIGGGIIINAKKVGNYCSANSGVIVGNKNGQDNRAEIGNYVSLNVGCKVVGKISIGDNVIVAPNSVVVKDVPENCVVSGIPAKIIKDSRDINNKSKFYAKGEA